MTTALADRDLSDLDPAITAERGELARRLLEALYPVDGRGPDEHELVARACDIARRLACRTRERDEAAPYAAFGRWMADELAKAAAWYGAAVRPAKQPVLSMGQVEWLRRELRSFLATRTTEEETP